MKLYFTTTNKGKYEEGKEVLSKYGIELIHINATKPEDKEKPIEQIAIEGAELLSKKYNKPLIVEDTGVFFKAYTNFPGPNAKLTFNQLGYKGIFKVLKGEDKRAYMKTALAYCEPGKKAKLFEGIVTGKITTKVYPPIDKHLPYDPIFIPDGFKKAFSLLPEIKGKVSHRVLAFEKLGRWLN